MAYTVFDLLDKFIMIEEYGYEMYMKIVDSNAVEEKVKTVARVFANEEKRHYNFFNKLKNEVEYKPGIIVDLLIYDKASKLISEFLSYDRSILLKDTRQILEFCLEFEKANLALLLNIQGILVKSQEDQETDSYQVFTQLINEEQKHIREISGFIK